MQLTSVHDRYAEESGSNSGGFAADANGDSGSQPTTPGQQESTTGPDADASSGPVAGPEGAGPEGEGSDQAAAEACAVASDAPGVTDDSITLGSISSLSGPAPGLGASAAAATRAYVAFINATGGVCGRELVLKEADDGTDIARYKSLMEQMNSDVLGIVGGFTAADPGGAQVVASNNIPVVSTVSSDQMEAVPTVFDTNPPFANPNQAIGKYDWLYAQGVRKAAVVYIDVAQSRSELSKHKAQLVASGIRLVHEDPLPLSTLSYDSAARGVANSGADYLLFVGDESMSASMATSMSGVNADLKFSEYLLAYGSNFTGLAGPAAEGTSSWVRVLPAEDQGQNAELDRYLEWMARVAPGIRTDPLASDAWVGAKAFVEALRSLPGPISRETLIAQLRTMDPFDADGFFGTIQLGSKLNGGCFVGMVVSNGEWKRMVPDTGFLC